MRVMGRSCDSASLTVLRHPTSLTHCKLHTGIVGGEVVSELVELSCVIADIYDAAIEPALWKQALASITAYVGGSSAVLYWHDAATERSEVLHLFNVNPEYTRLYFEKYLPMNPMFPAGAFYEAGVVNSTNDVMPIDEFVETRFYKEWVKPQGIGDAIAVNLEKGTTRASLLNVRMDASQGFENDDARSRMSLLVPHLQRAVSIGRLFDQQQATTQALASTLDHVEAAVFLVRADGTISFANDRARKMVEQATLVHARDNALHAIADDSDRVLRDVLSSAASGDASVGVRGVAVPLNDGSQERWFAHVLPLTSGRRQEAGQANRAVAAVFIRKGAPNVPLPLLEAIAKTYKLTASEVKVLDAVLKAKGVKAMAEMLGLSQATVKTHLQGLFRKTGTKRQGELVKLIAGA
jgi:DNA-binding CsgD family transcriptional regulator/PAS domain-containing protein